MPTRHLLSAGVALVAGLVLLLILAGSVAAGPSPRPNAMPANRAPFSGRAFHSTDRFRDGGCSDLDQLTSQPRFERSSGVVEAGGRTSAVPCVSSDTSNSYSAGYVYTTIGLNTSWFTPSGSVTRLVATWSLSFVLKADLIPGSLGGLYPQATVDVGVNGSLFTSWGSLVALGTGGGGGAGCAVQTTSTNNSSIGGFNYGTSCGNATVSPKCTLTATSVVCRVTDARVRTYLNVTGLSSTFRYFYEPCVTATSGVWVGRGGTTSGAASFTLHSGSATTRLLSWSVT